MRNGVRLTPAGRGLDASQQKVAVAEFERPTRKNMRYPVQAPVHFWWKGEAGDRRRGEGLSRDISVTGAFIFASDCPPIGTEIGIRIFLVAVPEITKGLCVETHGRVLRVEQITGGELGSGFAVLTRGSMFYEDQEISDGESW